MHLQLRYLLAALTGERSYRRNARLLSIVALLMLTIIIGFCAAFAYVVWQYWPTLLFNDFFGGGVFTLVSLALPALAFLQIPLDLAQLQRIRSSQPFALALAVRRALERGDATVAPVIPDQPEEDGERLFSSALADTGPLVVAVPAPLITPLADPIVLYVLAGLLFIMAGAGILISVTVSDPNGLIFLAVLCDGFALGGLLPLISGVRLTRRRAQQRRGMPIEVDSLGLTFRQPVWKKKLRQIAWAEMRALARFTYRDGHARLQTVYLVDSEKQTLMWAEPPDEAYAPLPQREMIAERRESARRLVTAITSRTRLPMRDLTDTMAALIGPSHSTTTSTPTRFLDAAWNAALFTKDIEAATMIWRVRQPGARRQPRALRKLIAEPAAPAATSATSATSDALATAEITPRLSRLAAQINSALASASERRQLLLRVARALIPYYPTETSPDTPVSFRRYLRRERWQRWLPLLTGATIVFLLVALLMTSAAGWYQERGVERMLRALPQQTLSQTPLYFASFTSPQADWYVHRATKDEPYAAAFVNGAYQVSSADPKSSAYFWIQRDVEGDIAISTAVTIHGPSSQDSSTTADILFDVTGNGYAFSMFGIDERGNWYLWRYDADSGANDPWSFVDLGSSSAIYTGEGATNALLLLRHGPLYLLYVNGALVDRYYDRDRSLPPGGDVGVYIDGGDIVARFNDFALYPIPPQLAGVPIASNLPSWLW